MQQLISHIEQLQLALSNLLPMDAAHQKKLDDKFRLEFNYNSNHLEGNTLTYGETKLLIIFGKTEGNHDKREFDEMEAHDVAFKLIKEWALETEYPLTEQRIKQLNKIILVKPFYKEAITQDGQTTQRLINIGDYKEYSNNVRLQNGETFEFATVTDTPILMGELMQWYVQETEKQELHPVILAALLHYKFVRIHPFDDGNGRVSRLLMNYVLLKNNLPPVVIKSNDKKNYLDALNKADTGNINAFIEYIAEQLIWSLNVSIDAAKGKEINEDNDWEKKLSLLKKKIGEEEYIQKKHSSETAKEILENNIIPVLRLWSEKIKKFEVFFDSINFYIKKLNATRKVKSLELIPNDFIITLKFKFPIQFYIEFEKPRKILFKNAILNSTFNAGEIVIKFYDNSYEIKTSTNKNINKLYHQNLSQEEMEKIVNELCDAFYKQIETIIN